MSKADPKVRDAIEAARLAGRAYQAAINHAFAALGACARNPDPEVMLASLAAPDLHGMSLEATAGPEAVARTFSAAMNSAALVVAKGITISGGDGGGYLLDVSKSMIETGARMDREASDACPCDEHKRARSAASAIRVTIISTEGREPASLIDEVLEEMRRSAEAGAPA